MRFSVLGAKAGGPPTLTNNFSATILWTSHGVILFDCGEGTQFQLLRSNVPFNHIHTICLSHCHGDHIWGLMPLLSAFYSTQRKAPLLIVAPEGIREFVEHACRLSGMKTAPFDIRYRELPPEYSGVVYSQTEFSITVAALEHRISSFGFRIDFPLHYNVDMDKLKTLGIEQGEHIGNLKKEGKIHHPLTNEIIHLSDVLAHEPRSEAFVYCGDTLPTSATVELARAATVLQHEATFSDQHQNAASEKFHSTAKQAASIARAANVEYLWISHVSNRYDDKSVLLEEAREIFTNTFLAQELEIVEIPFKDE